MTVRAKFRCNSITNWEKAGCPGEVASKQFTFTACGGDDNKDWARYTPTGELRITIDNPAAWQFEIGHSYFLDFSPAT